MAQLITAGVASADVRIDTANHRTAAQHVPPGAGPHYAQPSQVTWSDLHSVVDGKTLGRRFRDSLERLERLLYVVCGSMPPSYNPFVQWNHRYHPRCNWLVEQWEWRWCGTKDAYGHPNCGRIYPETFHEYAARGQSAGIPAPKVPVRSRSGDPLMQMLSVPSDRCDRGLFPIGSVTRSAGAEAFDPRGTGWFGGDPERIGHSGARQYAWEQQIAGEPVEIRWQCPAEFASRVVSSTLHWNGTAAAMSLVGGNYIATIPAQDHNTTVRWFIEVVLLVPSSSSMTRYEPGGTVAPSSADQYSYVAFSHFNPYANGLPELWSYCHKGTDAYQFDGTETIQVELINLVRFILDYLGRRFVHSPRLRSALPACCLHIPIKWRWSGSAPWPHYRSGGKSGARPLHNLDDHSAGADEEAARKSWRGVPFQAGGQYDNRVYPQNEHEASWLTPVSNVGNEEGSQIIRYMTQPPGDPDVCKIYWTSAHRGLQRGDVVDPVHILELIAAIDYLVDNGLWLMQPIKRRPVTPTHTFIDGLPCGWSNTGIMIVDPEPPYYRHFEPGSMSIGYEGWWRMGKAYCDLEPEYVPYPQPESWLDCWKECDPTSGSMAGCRFDACGNARPWGFGPTHIEQSVLRRCEDINEDGTWNESGVDWTSNVEYVTRIYSVYCHGFASPGHGPCGNSCGPYSSMQLGGCVSWSKTHNTREFGCLHSAETHSCGWEAWVCGPVRAPNGPDLLHGNSMMKPRMDHDCPAPNPNTGGVYYSMGNRLGDVHSCAIPVDTGTTDLGFEETRHLYLPGWTDILGLEFSGICEQCEGCLSEDEVPDPPGYTGKWDMSDPPQYSCDSRCYHPDPFEFNGRTYYNSYSNASCGMSLDGLDMCAHDYTWCAVDLNLQGDRMPALYDYVANPEATAWKDYDFALCAEHQDPYNTHTPCVAWFHQTDCPCETADPAAGSCGARPGDE